MEPRFSIFYDRGRTWWILHRTRVGRGSRECACRCRRPLVLIRLLRHKMDLRQDVSQLEAPSCLQLCRAASDFVAARQPPSMSATLVGAQRPLGPVQGLGWIVREASDPSRTLCFGHIQLSSQLRLRTWLGPEWNLDVQERPRPGRVNLL